MFRAPVLSLLFAVGCVAPSTSDIFWIELTPDSRPCADERIEENFTNARPSALVTGGSSTLTQSGSATYALVTRSDDGTVIVHYGDVVLTGTETEDGSLEVTWSGSDDFEDRIDAPTYTSTERRIYDVTETLTLRPRSGEDDPTWTGSLSVSTTSMLEYVETDEWVEAEFSGFSQVPSGQYLELTVTEPGSPPVAINFGDRDDCEGQDCRLAIVNDCTETFTLEGRLVDADVASFDALSGFGRPPGSGLLPPTFP
ncbi:MAG: hypothetical protein AAF211_16300 [Myxococcota bacterium]